MAGLTEKY